MTNRRGTFVLQYFPSELPFNFVSREVPFIVIRGIFVVQTTPFICTSVVAPVSPLFRHFALSASPGLGPISLQLRPIQQLLDRRCRSLFARTMAISRESSEATASLSILTPTLPTVVPRKH